jgi:hypothetical protein
MLPVRSGFSLDEQTPVAGASTTLCYCLSRNQQQLGFGSLSTLDNHEFLGTVLLRTPDDIVFESGI